MTTTCVRCPYPVESYVGSMAVAKKLGVAYHSVFRAVSYARKLWMNG
jgi:hypothetical protein